MRRPIGEQVVVITGASSGIGRSAARHFACLGARVVLTARRADALEALVDEIEAEGGCAIAVPGDVTSEEAMARVARSAVRHFGRIDTWINNAGVYIQGRVQDITLDDFRRVIEVDLIGVINGTRQALAVMLRQRSGVIIQVSSIVGQRGAPYTSAYSAAKAGIDGFTESLRAELWGSGIRASVFYPPSVDTPIYHNARARLGTLPRPAPPVHDPDEAAEALVELARTGAAAYYMGPLRYLYLNLGRMSTRLADAVLHRAADFTLTRTPALGVDNLDRPSPAVPPRERAGWRREGWRGFTFHDTVRVLPVETMLAAATLGFVTARLLR